MKRHPVVILGATGFIGRNLKRFLLEKGYPVAGAGSRECDLTDPDRVRAWFSRIAGPFDLIHAAVINRASGQTFQAFERNCRMMQNVLDALPAGRCRSFIYLSSVDVYGARPRCPVNEQTPTAPGHYYALAKLVCEGLLRLFPDRRFPALILRLPGIYGSDDGGHSLVGKLVRAVVRDKTVTVSGDGSLRRDLVSIDDLLVLIASCLEAPLEEVVNVATGESLSLLDIIAIIAEKAQCIPEIAYCPEPLPPSELCFDTARMQGLWPRIGFRPLAAGIGDYLTAFAKPA